MTWSNCITTYTYITWSIIEDSITVCDKVSGFTYTTIFELYVIIGVVWLIILTILFFLLLLKNEL